MRFLGNIEAKTDEKGRVFLPASFRKILQTSSEEKLVMRKDVFQNCLVLYPESVWNNQLDALRSRLNRWNAKHQMVFRQFVSEVELITPDANGRILIPKMFRECAAIRQEVCFIGMDNTIEIWAKELTCRPFMEAEEFACAMEDIMNTENLEPNE